MPDPNNRLQTDLSVVTPDKLLVFKTRLINLTATVIIPIAIKVQYEPTVYITMVYIKVEKDAYKTKINMIDANNPKHEMTDNVTLPILI